MFEEYAKGTHTYKSLATYLNSQGFVTKQGKSISLQVVEKTLKNSLYCGIIKAWNTETKGTFEPLVDENLFYLCQPGGKTSRNTPHKKVNHDFPLRKISICADCGEPLTGSNSKEYGCQKAEKSLYSKHRQPFPLWQAATL